MLAAGFWAALAGGATGGGGGGGGGTRLLDALTVAPLIALSTRKLRTAYSGSALRVRRSSDNAEQDIGFTAGGDLDTTTLTTFVGANSGYISKWYNQAPSAFVDLVQASATDQPLIVVSGTTQLFQAGKPPAVNFTAGGLNGLVTATDISLSGMTSLGLTGVFALTTSQTSGGAQILAYQSPDGSGYYNTGCFGLQARGAADLSQNYLFYNGGVAGLEHTGIQQFTIYSTSTAANPVLAYGNGASGTSNAAMGTVGASGRFSVGSDGSGGSIHGLIGEVILQTTYNSADVSAIATSQHTYWGTP